VLRSSLRCAETREPPRFNALSFLRVCQQRAACDSRTIRERSPLEGRGDIPGSGGKVKGSLRDARFFEHSPAGVYNLASWPNLARCVCNEKKMKIYTRRKKGSFAWRRRAQRELELVFPGARSLIADSRLSLLLIAI
jgi:hypothetical protein